jgi:hypothetical protein
VTCPLIREDQAVRSIGEGFPGGGPVLRDTQRRRGPVKSEKIHVVVVAYRPAFRLRFTGSYASTGMDQRERLGWTGDQL